MRCAVVNPKRVRDFAKAELIQSVPGIGEVNAMTLIAELPELGHLNRQQSVKFQR